MTSVKAGATITLVAEWREYEGGPLSPVTGVTIAITPVAGGAPVVAETATGVLTPLAGVNAYSWTVPSITPAGSYVVAWEGLDESAETVTAAEVVQVTTSLTAPLGGPYATRAALKARMGIADSNTARDTELDQRLISAATDINAWCHRQFGRAEDASTRRFYAGRSGVDTHDFWTDEDLVITPYVNGVAGTSWDTSTLELEPMDGIVNQTPGWPFNRIVHPMGDHPLTRAMSWSGHRIWVTAKWGWATVPENVVTANLMLAVADDKAKDAPFGVAGFGDYAVRIRQNPMVEEKLKDYVIDPVKVAT
jgi:hypothetical protein